MNHYTKEISILKFKIHYVKLGRRLTNEFLVSSLRGAFKGSTKKALPDARGIIKFNSIFETKCTLFKNSKGFRPKILQITLHRILSNQETRIYGKLNIDVTKGYGEYIKEELEMESGRSVPPTIMISYSLTANGMPCEDLFEVDDVSFIDEPVQKDTISQWDKTEVVDFEEKKEEPSSDDLQAEDYASKEAKEFQEKMVILGNVFSKEYIPVKSIYLDSQNNIAYPFTVLPLYGYIIHSKLLSETTDPNYFQKFLIP